MSKHSNKVHLQVVQHLSPGGIETMCLDLQKFSQANIQVHIVSLEGSKKEMLAKWPRLIPFSNYIHFLNKPPGRSLTVLGKLIALMRKLNVSLVHTHHIGPMLYGGLAARLCRVKHWIHTEHDAWHLENKNHRVLVGICIKLLKPLIVADAEAVAEHIKSKITHAKPSIIHNGIDTKRFCPGDKTLARNALGLRSDVTMLGCAARLHPVKGHDVLINALARLPSNVHLALAGRGEMESDIRHLAGKLGIADRVHLLGQVEDMPAFYRAIDVFCLASRNEGMPLSPIEAQACGTPAIVSDVGACSETLCKESGQLVTPGDENSLTDAILIRLATSISISPRKFVVENRDVKKMVSQYDRLVRLV